jgi:Reverse transcriptase (RNA-dependent DNA polymerase)
MLATIQKKHIKKVSERVSKTPEERLLMDISFFKQECLGKRNIWVPVEDQFSKMQWRKRNMVREIIILMKNLKQEGTQKEIASIENRGVWKVMDPKSIPVGRKLMGNKWVFQEKRNGVFRARLVALGHSQIPEIDFLENYFPVVNDSMFCLILLLIAKLKLKAWSLDVETLLLHGDFDEDIYIKIPDRFEVSQKPKGVEN